MSSESNWNPPVDMEFYEFANSGPHLFSEFCPEHQFEGRYRLHENDVYVEAGAFWARYGLIASHRVGPKGRVILIEGNPYNCDMIKQVIKQYDLKNITLVEGVVWSSSGEMDFSIRGNPAGSRIATNFDLKHHPQEVVKVNAWSLDDLLPKLGVEYVDLLCCDIEGAEWEMVKGAEKYFTEKRIRNVSLAAYHDISQTMDVHFYTLIMGFLKERGYKNLEFHSGLPHYGGLVYGNI